MITSDAELPEGQVLTAKGGVLELQEDMQELMVALSVAKTRNKAKECWVLATEAQMKTARFMQLINRAETAGYTIVRRDSIDEATLRLLYDRNLQQTSQEAQDQSKIIEFFDAVVSDALAESVSDIHIEKRAHGAIIKMRKHGEMLEYRELSSTHAYELCSVVYNVLAENRDIVFNDQEYQQAAINRVIEGIELKMRYQSLPVYPDGFDVVLRVLPIGKNEEYVPLEELGYTPSQIAMLMEIVSRPVGTLVIAGTTGSGKSTTLKNLLMYIHSERQFKDKIYTVEDPPEYKIPRVSQIPVIRRKSDDYSKKSPFEAPIAACMRADPDILMIGEVRDKATGDLLKKAVQSGHQVLTTVHAASALAIIDRMTDFEMSPAVLGSQEFISGLCYQKLVPTLCPSCAVSLKEAVNAEGAKDRDMALWERLKKVCDPEVDTIRVRGTGCEDCGNLGVVGRTVCAEIIIPDTKMLKFFREESSIDAHEHWRTMSDKDPYSPNMVGKSAMEHAMLKLRKGLVSPHDVESAFGPITPGALGIVIES
jgi:general secretion pathway protein E